MIGRLGNLAASSGSTVPSGEVKLRIIKAGGYSIPSPTPFGLKNALVTKPLYEKSFMELVRLALPLKNQSDEVRKFKFANMRTMARGLKPILLARHLGIPTFYTPQDLNMMKKWVLYPSL